MSAVFSCETRKRLCLELGSTIQELVERERKRTVDPRLCHKLRADVERLTSAYLAHTAEHGC